MISLLVALAGAQLAGPDEAQYRGCTDLIRESPQRAVEAATEWRLKGGGLLARQCLGLAFVKLERWAPAAEEFGRAAAEAEAAKDKRAGEYWTQSGNAWLAGGEAARARASFDAALASEDLTTELRGEVHFDRARAAVVQDDIAGARTDIDKGLELVPADPFGWYLSAALARRANDLPRAQADIAKSVTLAPDDANVLLEAGNIAGAAGDPDMAKAFFQRAVKAAPQSPAGRAAQAALVANGLVSEPSD